MQHKGKVCLMETIQELILKARDGQEKATRLCQESALLVASLTDAMLIRRETIMDSMGYGHRIETLVEDFTDRRRLVNLAHITR